MNKYELLYIISSDAPEEAREAIIKKFSDMVVADGGVVDSRRLLRFDELYFKLNFAS